MKPELSIIICTYNGENLIKNCLNSILRQNLGKFEIICVDGMSTDKTREIIKEYIKKDKRIKLIINNKRLPEGKGFGKWQGFKESKGTVFGIIDQDNILQREDLFFKVKEIFDKNKTIVGILGGVKHDLSDKGIIRYVSLIGTDSFFAYRSIDFLRNIQDFKKIKIGSENVEKVILTTDNLKITGGNCFFYNKKSLDSIEGYTQDILVLDKFVKNKKNELIIIKDSTKHYAENSFFNLTNKKLKWGKNFKSDKNIKKFNYLPKTKREFFAFTKNLIFCLTVIPNFIYSIKLYKKTKDFIAFLFPIMAFFNTLAYLFTYLFHK